MTKNIRCNEFIPFRLIQHPKRLFISFEVQLKFHVPSTQGKCVQVHDHVTNNIRLRGVPRIPHIRTKNLMNINIAPSKLND